MAFWCSEWRQNFTIDSSMMLDSSFTGAVKMVSIVISLCFPLAVGIYKKLLI